MIRFSSLLVGLILLCTPCFSRDSVVLITVDTLRADRLEAYGYAPARTPAITLLSTEGVTFENAIVQTPITLPSHATILTGTYPMYHRVQDVVGRLEGVPTLAEWFKGKNYVTGAFVGSSVLTSHWGLDRGFDTYDDYFPSQGLRQVDFDRLERKGEEVVDRTLNWLDKNGRSKPFFLWIHLYDPHDPYTPPEPFASQFKDRPYDGEIAYVDWVLERFLSELKQRKLYDSTLIVFTSDHGESLGEHKEAYHGYFVYEASLRVPLIIKLPSGSAVGSIRKGTRIPNQVRSVDLAPTIVHLLGDRVPATMQGETLVAIMKGRRPGLHLPAYSESHYPRIHFGWSPLFSYSTLDHKYIEAPTAELYDLKKDPGELKNIYDGNQALAGRMREDLHALQRKFATNASQASGSEQLDPETMERLKSLGYIAFSAGSSDAGGKPRADPKEKIDTYNQLNSAILLSRQGRVRMSIALLERVARQEPEMPVVHFLLGMEYFSLGQYLKAVEQFMETIRYNPESNVARFNLARAQSQAGLTDRAELTLRDLIASEPRHFAALHLLATILAKKGRLEEAIGEAEKALKIRPSFVEAHNNLGSYFFSAGQLDRAIASYRKALEYDPANLMARTNLSLAYFKQGRYDQALEQARLAVEQEPRYALAHYYLGQAYLAKGMPEEARSAFGKARELDPKLQVPDER